jgi:type VI secretion system secreted protein Hcp
MAVDLFLVFYGGGPSIQAPPVMHEYFRTVFRDQSVLEISEFSLGAANQLATSSTGGAGGAGGMGAGKATLSRLVVKRTADSVSPQLFGALAAGQHFPTVQLYGRKAGTQDVGPYLGYEFQTVLVSDIAWSSAPGDEVPSETVTFAYGAMHIGVREQDPKGKLSPPVKHGWSMVTNSQPQEADRLFPG